MIKKYCIWIMIALLSGCGTSQKARKARNDKENSMFNKWLNHSKAELIQAWGPPDSTFSDGKTGNILLYKERTDYKSVMNENYTGTQFSFRKEMYINADSTIYYWRSWRRK